MFIEEKDEHGNLTWRLIDPDKSKNYHDDNYVAAGEILFYLDYHMIFFDRVRTKAAEKVILEN